jgi:hypothetical protein
MRSKALCRIGLIACLVGLIGIKLIEHNTIEAPDFMSNPLLLFVSIPLIAVGSIWLGVSGIKGYYKTHKNYKFKFISKEPTPPVLILSFGQIIGGYAIAIFYLVWICKHGFNM